jgi:hypothetical protein
MPSSTTEFNALLEYTKIAPSTLRECNVFLHERCFLYHEWITANRSNITAVDAEAY